MCHRKNDSLGSSNVWGALSLLGRKTDPAADFQKASRLAAQEMATMVGNFSQKATAPIYWEMGRTKTRKIEWLPIIVIYGTRWIREVLEWFRIGRDTSLSWKFRYTRGPGHVMLRVCTPEWLVKDFFANVIKVSKIFKTKPPLHLYALNPDKSLISTSFCYSNWYSRLQVVFWPATWEYIFGRSRNILVSSMPFVDPSIQLSTSGDQKLSTSGAKQFVDFLCKNIWVVST